MSDLMKLRDKNELSRLKTLRDEFAMAALSGMMANQEWCKQSIESMANDAYLAADAMLKERAK